MKPTPSDLLQQIDTIIIRVNNLTTTADWYIGTLGLPAIWRDEQLRLVVLDAKGPVSITLWQTDEPLQVNSKTAAYPIFRTPDASKLRQELMQREVNVSELMSDHHVSYIQFFDPEGNILEACQVHE